MIKNFLISVVAILHAYFFVLEMFLWKKPLGLKTFAMKSEPAAYGAYSVNIRTIFIQGFPALFAQAAVMLK